MNHTHGPCRYFVSLHVSMHRIPSAAPFIHMTTRGRVSLCQSSPAGTPGLCNQPYLHRIGARACIAAASSCGSYRAAIARCVTGSLNPKKRGPAARAASCSLTSMHRCIPGAAKNTIMHAWHRPFRGASACFARHAELTVCMQTHTHARADPPFRGCAWPSEGARRSTQETSCEQARARDALPCAVRQADLCPGLRGRSPTKCAPTGLIHHLHCLSPYFTVAEMSARSNTVCGRCQGKLMRAREDGRQLPHAPMQVHLEGGACGPCRDGHGEGAPKLLRLAGPVADRVCVVEQAAGRAPVARRPGAPVHRAQRPHRHACTLSVALTQAITCYGPLLGAATWWNRQPSGLQWRGAQAPRCTVPSAHTATPACCPHWTVESDPV